MSLVVEWNGKQYDVDPSELTQRELDLIEQKTGLDWKQLMVDAVRCKANAVRALFWIADRRDDDKVTYGDYDGPPMRVWLDHLAEYNEIVEALGKQLTSVFGTSGLDESPPDADTPQPSTTP